MFNLDTLILQLYKKIYYYNRKIKIKKLINRKIKIKKKGSDY